MNPPPNRLLPIVFGTLVMTFVSVFPVLNLINLFCCAGILLGGLAGVFFYNKQIQNTQIELTTKDGGIIGLLCGIVSAILVSGINLLLTLFSDVNPINEAYDFINKLGQEVPPEVTETMDKFSDEFNQYGFSPTLSILSLVMNLIIYPLFGAIGAVIGVSIIKKRQKS
ncbi:MAG: hypothetical protein ISS16_09945 [Ignavibacteria bacterium]|nr:hypothetical protein [Ignavibacteria bacterium]